MRLDKVICFKLCQKKISITKLPMIPPLIRWRYWNTAKVLQRLSEDSDKALLQT